MKKIQMAHAKKGGSKLGKAPSKFKYGKTNAPITRAPPKG